MSSNTRAGRRKSPPATRPTPKPSAPPARSVSAASSTASTEVDPPEFVGIDVGGERKGFHACALAGRDVVAGPLRLPDVGAVREWVAARDPALIGIDSPRDCAAPGESSRPGERALARAVCGIRWTPEPDRLLGPYYGWVRHGLRLYEELAGWETVEVFPTASWTVWAGRRGKRRRAAWSTAALAALDGIEQADLRRRRLSQDDRDAIAAALTARLHAEGRCREFGPIIVPASPRTA